MKITVFLDLRPCNLEEIYTLSEKYSLHNQDRLYLEDVRKRFLKSRSILPDYTASLPVKATYKYITLLILNVCLNPHFASV
jgi:hypothetical protein